MSAAPPRPTRAWDRMGPVKRAVLAVLALAVGINVGLSVLRSLTGGADPGGPRSSALATGDDGMAAWSDLLAARSQPVTRLRRPLSAGRLDPGATLIVADPEGVTPDDVEAVARFVGAGGRLVAAGETGAALVAALAGTDLGWVEAGEATSTPLAPVAETIAVGEVRGSGIGTLASPGPFLPVLGAQGRTVGAVQQGPTGQGSVVVVADSTVFQNRFLAEADNAGFALAVTAGRPVVFAEAVHGFGASRGLAALPGSWKRTAGALLVAVLLGFWAYGQRFGPPEETARRLPPARRLYVDAIAASLARTGQPVAATAGLRADARRLLLARTSLPHDATDDDLRAAAAGARLSEDEADALLSDPLMPDPLLSGPVRAGSGPADGVRAGGRDSGVGGRPARPSPSGSPEALLALGRAAARLRGAHR